MKIAKTDQSIGGNVLITEEGGVQLCDFGVSSIRESASDKRKTYVGSQHWMAPEFYRPETQRSYGSEVDIWAFGCMAYEIITGMPPNARLGIDQLWQRLQDPNKPMPRLDANKYSKDLVDLVDSCLQFRPEDRPTIQDLLKHRYLANTEDQYPTSALKDLVKAFKRWESVGNVRQSLFMPGGASGPKESEDNYTDDNSEWNFSSTLDFDEDVNVSVGDDDVRRVYGSNVDLSGQMNPEMPPEQTSGGPRRRRAPPKNLNNAVKAPLERMFDPNTVRGYKDFSDEHYFRNFVKIPEPSTPSSDLPLRKDEGPIITRTSMIDLDLDMGPGPPSSNFASFGEQQLTLRQDNSFGNSSQSGDFSVRKDRPQTQEWTFASAGQMSTSDAPSKTQNQFVIDGTIKPADRSARPRPRRVPTMAEPGEEEFKLGRGRRPSLVHAATEPTGQAFNNYRPQAALTAPNAATGRESLIDLDFGLMPTSDYTPFQSTPQSQYTPDSSRPQTAMSESESELGDKNPFELERHLQYRMSISKPPREPSLYVDDRYSTASIQSGGHLRQTSSISDLTSDAASGSESSHYRPSRSRGHATRPSESSISDAEHAPRSQLSAPFTPFRHQDMMDMSMSTDEMSLMPAMRLMNMYDDDADLEGELTNVLAAFDGEMQKTLDLFKEFVEPAPASRRSRDGAGGDEANGPPAMN